MTARYSFVSRWFNYLFMMSCLFVFAYPAGRLSDWYFQNAWLALLIALFVWGATILVSRYSFSGPRMKVRYLVVHWMGTSFILASITLFIDILRLILPIGDSLAINLVLGLSLLAILIAVLISHYLAVKQFTITSPKLDREYRVAQISDVHIGSRQKGFMARIVRKINSLSPDFVVITGDLIDSSAVDIEALESLRNLNAKTLFSIGNHERYADLDKVIDMAEQLGITMLRQAAFESPDLVIHGIDDADHVEQVSENLPDLMIDKARFNVLLYHRPVGWEAAIEHGIDLMLSGHTHNGQIFPFNWVVRQQFQRIAGLYEQDGASLYVSSGTGTWGPLMRLGSFNEVTLFHLKPN